MDCVWQSPTKLNIGFYTKEFLGSGSRKIIYRVDAKPPHTVIGSYSDHASWPLCENECKENDKSGPGIILLNEMKGGSTLLLRLINYRGNDVNFSFQIDGAREAFEQVAAGCAKLAAEKKKPKARP